MIKSYLSHKIEKLPPKQRTGQGRKKPGQKKRGRKALGRDEFGFFRPTNPPVDVMRQKHFADKYEIPISVVAKAVKAGSILSDTDTTNTAWVKLKGKTKIWLGRYKKGRKYHKERRIALSLRDERILLLHLGGWDVPKIMKITGLSRGTVVRSLWHQGHDTPGRSEAAKRRNERLWKPGGAYRVKREASKPDHERNQRWIDGMAQRAAEDNKRAEVFYNRMTGESK